MKIKTALVVTDFFTKQALKVNGADLTFKDLVFHSLNLPPAAYGAPREGISAKHATELRGSILEKVSSEAEVEFLPEQKDEILFCVSAVQPPSVYLTTKAILDGNYQVKGK